MTPQEQSRIARDIAHLAPIIPVLVVEDVAHARPLAEALVRGHLPALEVTLRTPAALDAIAAMAGGAGRRRGCRHAAHAPGRPRGQGGGREVRRLARRHRHADRGLHRRGPAAPARGRHRVGGDALLERGYDMLKFFPAEAAGGAPYLKSLAGPLPQVSFCPTGGVSTANALDYLRLPNVICAGGSWVAPARCRPRGLGRDRGAGAGRGRAPLGGEGPSGQLPPSGIPPLGETAPNTKA
jgi:2-dehydro-3-deoxyphosphogluconate aldolase/(4S)-4-hydroxy-2-oxoglutarate aldolase